MSESLRALLVHAAKNVLRHRAASRMSTLTLQLAGFVFSLSLVLQPAVSQRVTVERGDPATSPRCHIRAAGASIRRGLITSSFIICWFNFDVGDVESG